MGQRRRSERERGDRERERKKEGERYTYRKRDDNLRGKWGYLVLGF